MSKRLNLRGERFDRLVVIECVGVDKHQRTLWRCACDCGGETIAMNGDLKQKHVKSCGCLFLETCIAKLPKARHGHWKNGKASPTYIVWRGMLGRCENPKTNDYKYYGGRGIKVCDRWHTFDNFLADMGERPPGLTLDRKESDKDYDPDNCRWATWKEQAATRRKRDNQNLTPSEHRPA